MVRKIFIAVLMLAAAGTLVALVLTTLFTIEYVGRSIRVGLLDGMVVVASAGPPVRSTPFSRSIQPKNRPFFGELPLIWFPRRVQVQGVRGFGIPLWMIFLLFAAYPIATFSRAPIRRWRRRRKGLCVECGYDLTGNVSGVCPECGAVA
jgi:hypothetical protein